MFEYSYATKSSQLTSFLKNVNDMPSFCQFLSLRLAMDMDFSHDPVLEFHKSFYHKPFLILILDSF